MKTLRQYSLLSVVVALAVTGATVGTIASAQTVTPLSCSVGTSPVNANQATVLTATGGNGLYYWSGTNLNVTNATGSQFAVSYPNAGVYTVTVTSAGQSANCTFTVLAAATTGALACYPATQNVTVGQIATFSATGGTGVYTWSSPDLAINNPNGSGFSANYATPGLKTLSVTSGGVTDTCEVNVLSKGTTLPGLPNTGGGFGQ